MIWHSIEAANKSGLFDHVFVSTESEKIAAIARDGGAEVPFMRPVELSDDHTPIYDILFHAVQWMQANYINLKYLCCIYATAPFIKDTYLRQGFEIVASGKASRAFTVATYPASIDRALTINELGLLEMIKPEHRLTRSQDLPITFHNAGLFHWYNLNCFEKGREHISGHAAPIIIPRHLAHDIDTLEDWEVAEIIFNCLFNA